MTATANGITNPTYSYDANGNLTAGLGRTLTWTSFNMPAGMVGPNNLVPGTSVSYAYVYNADHERVKHVITTSAGTDTTVYLHPGGSGLLLYEKQSRPAGGGTLTEHKNYVMAGAKLVGVYLSRSDSTADTRYFHTDQLGSLTLITNGSGAVVESLGYEAFGKRRYVNGAEDTPNVLYGITTDRGYTGHEMLDEMGLIHMNGRVYDPLLGRFMTADPTVPDPLDLQSYNRYSYVRNNPFLYTDPTGYEDTVLGAIEITASRLPRFSFSEAGLFSGLYYTRTDYVVFFSGQASVLADGRINTYGNAGKNQIKRLNSDNKNFNYSEFSDKGHLALTALGVMPVVGIAFDGVDFVWYGVEFLLGEASGKDVGLAGAAVAGSLAVGVGDVASAAAKAANIAEKAAAKGIGKDIKEGIYEFIDTTGKKYCGQSCDIPSRLSQHIKSGKLDSKESVKSTEVLGGKTVREKAEHKRIQEITGGVPARFSDKVSNKVDPIGPNRRHLLNE